MNFTSRHPVELDYQSALKLHSQGRLEQARQLYQKVLSAQPRHIGALHHLGTVALQQGAFAPAKELLTKAVQQNAGYAPARINLSMALSQLGEHDAALQAIDAALAIDPKNASAMGTRIGILMRAKRFNDLIEAVDALRARGVESADLYEKRGLAYASLGRFEEADGSYQKALVVDPGWRSAQHQRVANLIQCRRYDQARALAAEIVAQHPDDARAHANLGLALSNQGHKHAARASLEAACRLAPSAEFCAYLAHCLIDLREFDLAQARIVQGFALEPAFYALYAPQARLLMQKNEAMQAIEALDRFLSHEPDNAKIRHLKAQAYLNLKQYAQAIAQYQRCDLDNTDFALSEWLHCKAMVCDWSNDEEDRARLIRTIDEDRLACAPFTLLGALDDNARMQKAAQRYLRCEGLDVRDQPMPTPTPSEKIRIGYFSADFYSHATAYLVAEVIESHDKRDFEVYGFSFGPPQSDAMVERLKASFDGFLDVSAQSDDEVVAAARALGLDIAIDLKGHTTHSRFGLFARGCAPVQINLLGYPATLGSEYVDYIVADETVIPAQQQHAFSEKVIYLPDSYQCNDSQRQIASEVPTREQLGLPDNAFVFCSFNNNYKITAAVFERWMQLLKAVDNAVLWLFQGNADCVGNLRAAAQVAGVDPARLVFSSNVPLPAHLARLQRADLFLDTFPCNAHTTASDALWAGVPLLTCAGQSFQSRVAASLLKVLDLDELVTDSLDAYTDLALALARSPSRLQGLRQRLLHQRNISSLFNGKTYARHLEQAYKTVHERHQAGLPPTHLHISRAA